MILFRASAIGDLMTYPEKSSLTDGAVTKLNTMISQNLLNWQDAEFDYVTTEKGKVCEEESIDLYNYVKGEMYEKNVERITKDNITGECDLIDFDNSLVIDIKTAYSKKTFPLVLKLSKLYEWQLRAYMYLYDVNQAELAYCLVNTPEELKLRKDPTHWHIVDDVPINLRVSTLRIDRDLEKENQMLKRIALCSKYVNERIIELGV